MKEEEIILESDIPVICIVAESFPDGVMAAHQKLHGSIPFNEQRRYFGISWGTEGGGIHYRAGAEIMDPHEAGIESGVAFTIRKGKYLSSIIHNYMTDPQGIGQAFQKMLNDPEIDPQGYCVEWYLSKEDVRCMVPLK